MDENEPSENGEHNGHWWGKGIFNSVGWGSIYKPKDSDETKKNNQNQSK